MAALTPAAREQLLRIARIFGTLLLAQPAVTSLVATTLVRYPLIAAVVVAVEVTYHEVTRRREVVQPGSRTPAAPPPSDTHLS